jgi:predicted aldo/keto reductase-like oxidoreductase
MQQSWNRGGAAVKSEADITGECQANFVAIIRQAIALGINHFETARGYGCSELQYGMALKELIDSGEVKREDIIVQSKASASNSAAKFRETLETCFKTLQVDYLDLFAFHGINRDYHNDWILKEGGCMEVAKEYQAAGKIRHIGFSTHGQPSVVETAINSGLYDYMNIHYQFIGSYTGSGGGNTIGSDSQNGGVDVGHKKNIASAQAQDMGVFIISPFDKGGSLYAPSTKLVSLCAPDMSPIAFECLWSWHHVRLVAHVFAIHSTLPSLPATHSTLPSLLATHSIHSFTHTPHSIPSFTHTPLSLQDPPIHTLVVGAARPTDFDEAANAARLFQTADRGAAKLALVQARLHQAAVDALGAEWLGSCYVGLPSCFDNELGIFYTHMIWLYNVVKAWGLLEFAKNRYQPLLGNRKKWQDDATWAKNMDIQGWGYCPGVALKPTPDPEQLKTALTTAGCPNSEKVVAALLEIHALLSPDAAGKYVEPPAGCEDAFDLRPWTAWCERG